MGMTERLREFLREDLSLSDGMKHVAVIGRAGSGKTTFINSIRGFYPVEHDSDALEFGHAPARAPVVRGRRLGPVRYQSLLTPGMVWWDMPSISNADDCLPPTVCFYRAYDLALYDYVILLYEGPMDSVSGGPECPGGTRLLASLLLILSRPGRGNCDFPTHARAEVCQHQAFNPARSHKGGRADEIQPRDHVTERRRNRGPYS